MTLPSMTPATTIEGALDRSACIRLLSLLLEPPRPGRLEEARALMLEWRSRRNGTAFEGDHRMSEPLATRRGERGGGGTNDEGGMTNDGTDRVSKPLVRRRGERGRAEAGEARGGRFLPPPGGGRVGRGGRDVLGEDLDPILDLSEESAAAEHFRIFRPAGPISPLASDHIGSGFADKGPILADIAGFYRAFGFTPLAGEPPDHLASMLAFLSFLALKQAYALHAGLDEEAAIAREAEEKFLATHLTGPLTRFLDALDPTPLGRPFAQLADAARCRAPRSAAKVDDFPLEV
ncbi:MAG: molecular chaperone TorD family protein [Planctomycetes bacterium]|nr:molecular chaperone TorD family protein [Planctomycetota bacterium]